MKFAQRIFSNLFKANQPIRLPPFLSLGWRERKAVRRVLRSGRLSGFYGNWGPEFLGGLEVRALEREWAARFEVPFAISVNSAASGLYAAMGAIGIGPGDEVIVPPYTMSATAMAPLVYGGIPVFVDIEPNNFCLDVEKVVQAITSKTKAVLAVNLFGHPAELSRLRKETRERGIFLVEDNAQGPLGSEQERYAGTVGDIGVFSLNYHKHIHTGEGGICVTRDPELALRLQAIRNHAENIVETAPIRDPTNMVGYNYRMTELSAAIGRAQLKRIDRLVSERQILAEALSEGLTGLEGVTPPAVRPGCRHVYYVWAMRVCPELGVSRETFSQGLHKAGFPHFNGYVRPLYLLPAFQKRIAVGGAGWPFTLTDRKYERGLCPVTERMHEKELLCFETCAYRVDSKTRKALIRTFRDVHARRNKL